MNDGPIDTYQLKSLDGQLEGDLATVKFTKHNGKIYMSFKGELCMIRYVSLSSLFLNQRKHEFDRFRLEEACMGAYVSHGFSPKTL